MSAKKRKEQPATEAEEMRLVTMTGVGDAPLPVKYEAAKAALAECARVDECSTWAKKAAALASYARQSNDDSLEKMAMRIRARAVRRCGELYREIPAKASGRAGCKPNSSGAAPPPITSARAAAAQAVGHSRDQLKEALRVAKVPAADFEAAVESDDPPTVAELAERGTKAKPKPLVDIQGRDPKEFNRSLMVKGDIEDFAAKAEDMAPTEFLRGCLPRHYRELSGWVPTLLAWLCEVDRLVNGLLAKGRDAQ